MAKLRGASIAGMNQLAGKFAGSLDFYYWKGIPVVRRWPKKFKGVIAPSQLAASKAFAEVARRKARCPKVMRDGLSCLAGGSTYTWGDLFTRWQLNYYRAEGVLPPEILDIVLTTGSGLHKIDVQLSEAGQVAVGAMGIKSLTSTLKSYRGTEEECKEPKPDVVGIRYVVPVKVVARSGKYTTTWAGKKKIVATLGANHTPEWWRDKILALYTAAPQSAAADTDVSNTFTLYGTTMPPYICWGGNAYGLRILKPWTIIIPPGWTLEEINGVRFYIGHWTDMHPLFELIYFNLDNHVFRYTFNMPGQKKITVAFSPIEGQSYTFSIQHYGFYNPDVHHILSLYPSPQGWQTGIEISEYHYTKGPRKIYQYGFTGEWGGNVLVEYLAPSGKTYPAVPVVQIKDDKAAARYADVNWGSKFPPAPDIDAFPIPEG